MTSPYQSYFDQNPPTSEELVHGGFLRVVKAVNQLQYHLKEKKTPFLWSVLCATLGQPVQKAPKVKGPKGALCTSTKLAEDAVMLSDQEWIVCEYELRIPYYVRSFTVVADNLSFNVSFDLRNTMIFAGWDLVANAASQEEEYGRWFKAHSAQNQGTKAPEEGPLMSIVTPAYKTPPVFLRELLESVVAQTYANWQLVIVNASPEDAAMQEVLASYDDPRIVVVEQAENLGISGNTNKGIEAAQGDYVSFLDHDDLIEPNALAEMVLAIQASEQPVDLMYCDEDSIDENYRYLLPLFKPDLNKDLEYSNNYMVHMLTVSRYVLEHTQRSGKDMDGSQDYDLTLKAFEVARSIVHIPKVLYHWRIHSASTNANPDAKPYVAKSSIRALKAHFDRIGVPAQVEKDPAPFTYHTRFLCGEDDADQGTSREKQLRLKPGIWAVTPAGKLRMRSRMASLDAATLAKAARKHTGEYLLCVTESIALSQDGLAEMAGCLARSEVFCASPLVVRADGLIDYAGAIVRPDGAVLRMSRFLPKDDRGYIGRTHHPYDALVVNPEVCLLKADDAVFLGFAQGYGSFEYLLSDLCARSWAKGSLNVYNPNACAQLTSPRSLLKPCAQIDCSSDQRVFLDTWGHLLADGSDPSHNPNFDPENAYYLMK